MKPSLKIRSFVLFALTLTSMTAHAYVGPGLGLGLIGVILGGILAILLAIGGTVWYPIKRLLKKTSADKSSDEKGSTDTQPQDRNDEPELRKET